MPSAPLAGILQLHAKIICLEIKLGLDHGDDYIRNRKRIQPT
jgi:hypothetical protein